ncbi:MAG TPA: hypothetical protein EYP20_05335 [Aigarchaeota archaeon]|nr:hypothetical protein [Aigarchaeota archaeon]
MKVSKKVLNRVEGEVLLKLLWDGGKVKDAYVCAPNFRGFERVLEGKPYLDALVLTPRVCGICGHAHLMATVRAVEDAYGRRGIDLKVSEKALWIRKITALAEIVQNHIRWFYLYLMPDFVRLNPKLADRFEPLKGKACRKALDMSNRAIKVIAIFGGQWPHTSYAIPGGVVCDPNRDEILRAKALLSSLLRSFCEEVFGMSEDSYLSLSSRDYLSVLGGDLRVFVEECFRNGLDIEGRSYARFLVGGEIEGYVKPGVINKRVCGFHLKYVKEIDEYSFLSGNEKAYTWSRSVRYRGLPFETGPLARTLVSGNKPVTSLYRTFGDSCMVRVVARVDETFRLISLMREALSRIDPREPSWRKPPVDQDSFTSKGVGVVEAARGTLIHEIEINKGRIKRYNIITPTVWNLGPRDGENLGVVEKSLIGLDSEIKAHIVLRSFDVCSVCTAH